MAERRRKFRPIAAITLVAALFCAAYLSPGLYRRAMTINRLLTENTHLKQALTNLTDEKQIGYAKVLDFEQVDGQLMTRLKFVETAPDNKRTRILEKEYLIPGDVIHFDALIVKFGDKMVMDGKARAMYLWRRIYGEKTKPQDGFPIEEPGAEPKRYEHLLAALPLDQQKLFWDSIWQLANDPEKLKQHDIEAVYGNVVYSRLQQGLIYVFKIDASGQLYPEVVPDL